MIPLNDDSLDKAFSSICENVLIEKLETDLNKLTEKLEEVETDLKELTEKLEALTKKVGTLEILIYGQSFSGYVSMPSTSPVYVGDFKWGDINTDRTIQQTYPSGDFYTRNPPIGITTDEYAEWWRHTLAYQTPGQGSMQTSSNTEDSQRRQP